MIDFSIPPELEDVRQRTTAFMKNLSILTKTSSLKTKDYLPISKRSCRAG